MSLFGTAGIRGPVGETVTPALALAVGRAVARLANDRGAEAVTVGRDGRTTGPALAAALSAGVRSGGVRVSGVGQVPTPALAFASREGIGVMITASHNPPADNGIKLFDQGAEIDTATEAEIEDRLEATPARWDEWKGVDRAKTIGPYRDHIVDFARAQGLGSDGLRVVVDCGNGMAALAVPQVLDRLGAEVTALNANIDGRFPARGSKPTAETMTDLRRFVGDGPAELGLGFDGDADRIVVVDAAGDVVHEDTIVAVLAGYYVEESPAATPLVLTTPNASARIDERVTAGGGETSRVGLGSLPGGFADARSRGRVVAFAAEPWKHVHPRLGDWIDAVASAAVVTGLVADHGGLKPLRKPITEWPYRKRSVSCPDTRKPDAMARLEDRLQAAFPGASATFDHGIRLEFPDGSWVLVRPSGTEPLLRIYAEGEDVESLLSTTLETVEAAV